MSTDTPGTASSLARALLLSTALWPRIGAAGQQEDPSAEAGRAEAVAAVEALGGSVQPTAQGSEEWIVSFSIHGREATDDALLHLASLGPIVELGLGRTRISDVGLTRVAALRGLKRLDLHCTRVGDDGLKALAGCDSLEWLNLYGTQVSDVGLDHLLRLGSLRRLYVWDSQVTPAGAAMLEQRLPGLSVEGGWVRLEPPEAEPGTCCTQAAAKGEACEHECCVAARAGGELCAACNPPEPEPEPAPEPEPPPEPALRAGSCCDQAEKQGEVCSHPCCVSATARGEICSACNA